MVRTFRSPGAIPVTGPWEGRVSGQLERTRYRVVQEALTNVAKHARAHRLSLILNRRADDLLVIIEDDGDGFNVEEGTLPVRPARKLGLVGMRQRVQAVGGDFQVESHPGGGTTLFVRVPLPGVGARQSDG